MAEQACPVNVPCEKLKVLQVRGEVHHDRRLHQLMLQEDCKEWARHVAGLPADGVAPPPSVTSEESEPEDILIQPASSPTDSVSSLHAECSSDLSKEPPIYRCAWRVVVLLVYTLSFFSAFLLDSQFLIVQLPPSCHSKVILQYDARHMHKPPSS